MILLTVDNIKRRIARPIMANVRNHGCNYYILIVKLMLGRKFEKP
jgi:hypothetical protein